MGLYDGYRLDNSRSVKQYQGSAVPEMVAVSNEMQRRYDMSQDKIDYANQFLNSITSLPQDQGEFNKVKAQFSDSLATLGKRPDLENAVRETTMLANRLPQEYAPFAQRMKDFADRKEELKKATEKNPGDAGYLSPETADRIMQMDIHQDRGIQKDPTTGKYNGRFTGTQFPKDVQWNTKVDNWLEHAKPVVNGRKVEYLNGDWIDSQTRKTVTMDPRRIQQIVMDGIANDPEAKASISFQQKLGTYDMDYSHVDPNSLQLTPDIQARLARGESLTAIAREQKGNGIAENIVRNAQSYAVNKYAQHDLETEQGMTGNPFALKQMEREATPRFLIPGNDTVLEDKDKNLSSLNTTIGDLKGKLTQMEGDMKLADDAGKARIQSEMDATKDILTAKEGLLNNTKDAIAKRMSGGQYKTADEYYDKTSKSRILAALPASITGTADGKSFTINKESLHDALRKGRIERVTGVSTGTGMGDTTPDTYYVTLDNGRKVKVDSKDFDKVATSIQATTAATGNFDAAVKKELETNAAAYSFKPLSMNLSEPEQKGLNDIIKAEPNSVAWTKPGSTDRVKDKDLPAGMDIGSMKVIAKNGSFYLNSSGYDMEKGQKKPNGQTYTAKITPGSNVGKKIASNLIKEGKGIQNLDSDMLLTVGVLSGQYRYTGDIASLQNYEPLSIRDKAGKNFLRAQRIKGTTDSDQNPVYGLVDEKGNVLKDAQGNFYQTNDPSTVDYWIQHALQADMLKK